jgi:hypothetical protein
VALLTVLFAGCTEASTGAGVESQQIDSTWVFTYSEEPSLDMHALHGGSATVADGCLEVGDMVVVWHDHHLPALRDVIASVQLGEAPRLELGGGGVSLDEGAAIEDIPAGVREHCAPSGVWYASSDDFTVLDE